MDLRLRQWARQYRLTPTDELAHRIAARYAGTIPDPQLIADMNVAQCHLPDQEWFTGDEVPDHIDQWLRDHCCFWHVSAYEYIVNIGPDREVLTALQPIPIELQPIIQEALAFQFDYVNFYIA